MQDEIKGKIHWQISANDKTNRLNERICELYGLAKIVSEEKNCAWKKKNQKPKSFVYISIESDMTAEINNKYIDRSAKYLLPDQSNIRSSVIFCD